MLGVLYKVSRKTAPIPIQSLFSLRTSTLIDLGFGGMPGRHDKQLHDPVAFYHPVMIRRSVFGLVRVFNCLPQNIVNAQSPKRFQTLLLEGAKLAAKTGRPNWELMYRAG